MRIPFTLMLLLAMAAGPARALTPADVYASVAPSVWRVQTYDADGVPLGLGSAVVIGPQTLVTNCHVLAKAKRVMVKREKVTIEGKLDQWDPQRDVCQIRAPGLDAPAVTLGEVSRLQVGQTVYAIGNPQGLDLTMSSGLLSSIRRNEKEQVILLQTSAAISRGSSGGGLFDEHGALIGLTTLGSVAGDAQNLNFAIPVDWVRELPHRHALLNKGAAPAVAAASTVAPASAAVTAVCLGAGKRALEPASPDTELGDPSRLPHGTPKMLETYRSFLTCPLPRAFAISEGGKWWYAWSNKPRDTTQPADPSERALRNCEKTNSGHCFLYAVDQRVVYSEGP